MHSYGVDPNAPVFPFVIPTLLFRPFAFLWRPLFAGLAWCFGVLFSGSSSEDLYSGPRYYSAAAAAGKADKTFASSSSGTSGNGGVWAKVSWFGKSNVGEAWEKDPGDLGTVREMDGWSRGYEAWEFGEEVVVEVEESMEGDEVV